jgi:hypothetical protein
MASLSPLIKDAALEAARYLLLAAVFVLGLAVARDSVDLDASALKEAALRQEAAAKVSDRLYKDGISGAEFQALLKRLGQETVLRSDAQGDPEIDGRVDDTNYAILFYGCNKEPVRRCFSYQYYLSYRNVGQAKARAINDYNLKMRFGAAGIDPDGTAELRLSIIIDGGVTEENFANWFELWKLAIKEFQRAIEFE